MENLPTDILYLISKFLNNHFDICNLRLVSKEFYNSIPKLKLKILYIDYLFKFTIKNKRVKCINAHNNELQIQRLNIGKTTLYYPFYKQTNNSSNDLSTINQLIMKKVKGKLVRNLSDSFSNDFYKIIEKSGKEIINVSDNLIKNNECKYGMYTKRFIPYCFRCIKKYDLIDDCKFIMIC